VGTLCALCVAVGDKQHELRALRTIVVSGRAALHKASNPAERERITERVTELLADLEEVVIRDGADSEVISALEEARRKAWD
jgi:hypothetical protein